MTHFKIVRVSDLAIIAAYDNVNPFGGPLSGSDGSMVCIAVPDVTDPNGVIAVRDDAGVISLVFDQATLDGWKRVQNKTALDVFSLTRTNQADTDIKAALVAATGMVADDTTHLMTVQYATDVLNFPEAWVQTLIGDLHNGSITISNLPNTVTLQPGDAVGGDHVPDDTVITDILTSTSVRISHAATADSTSQNITFNPTPVAQGILATYRPLFVQINAMRAQRDRDIANFTPPYDDVSPLYPA